MKVLFVVDFPHFLLDSLYAELAKHEIAVTEVCVSEKIGVKNKPRCKSLTRLKKLFSIAFIISHILFRGRAYDAVSYHYATPIFRYVDWFSRLVSKRRVLTIWGSEFLRSDCPKRRKLEAMYNAMDAVSVTNPELLPKLKGVSVEVIGLSFGLGNIDRVKTLMLTTSIHDAKQTLGLNPGKTHIVIGTNAAAGQQHLKVIQQLRLIDNGISGKCELVFPLTYGSDSVRRSVTEEALRLQTPSYFFTDEMSDDDVARLRVASDILIQVQETDQLSGAMLETIFAGGFVITGAWLPYGLLDELGVDWARVGAIDELASVVAARISKAEVRAEPRNSQLVGERYSWSVLGKAWAKFLTGKDQC